MAGTLVCTVDGEVPIEDIEVGDYVLAENPDTGEIDYKPVLETYEHDTYDVVYLTIDGEEFTTTEGHPFYVEGRGFEKAGRHMVEKARYVPMTILQKVIECGQSTPDPRGLDAIMYYSRIFINEKLYNIEVLYNRYTNTVYHFEYTRRAIGMLDEIKK